MIIAINKRTNHVGVFSIAFGDYILVHGNEDSHHFFYRAKDFAVRYTIIGDIMPGSYVNPASS